MATYKKRTYKKRTYKRKPRSKWGSYASTAVKALSIASKVARLVNIETKEANKYVNSTVNWNGAIFSCVDHIAQGINDSTRIGDSVKIQKIKLSGFFSNTGSTSNDITLRWYVVNDKANSGLTITDLFEDSGSTYAPFSSKATDNKYKSTVLYDSGLITLVGDTSRQRTAFTVSIPVNGHVQYTNGTTTVASNNYKVYIVTGDATATFINYQFTNKTYYTDD